jgi:signal transduction histidine kinase
MSVLREVQSPDASDIGRQWEREMAVRVMTAYVAHELNHPLGTIINLVNILSRRLADPVVRPKDISEHVQNIRPKRFVPPQSSEICACSPSTSRRHTKA